MRETDRLVWELEQRRLIAELLMDYSHFVDRNDPQGLVARVFCEDGCFELGARHAVVGRADLALMFARTLAPFSRTSHHVTNIKVMFTGAETAESTAYVYAWHLTVLEERRIDLWGRYHDQHRLTAEGWRIATRRLTVAGSDGWIDPPFDLAERLRSPPDTPSPKITKPAALVRTTAAGTTSQKKHIAGTARSKQTPSSASNRVGVVAAGIRLTAKRRVERARTASISCAIRCGDSRTMPRMPKPPAAETAATSSDRATPPMPADRFGTSQPSRSQIGVRRRGICIQRLLLQFGGKKIPQHKRMGVLRILCAIKQCHWTHAAPFQCVFNRLRVGVQLGQITGAEGGPFCRNMSEPFA